MVQQTLMVEMFNNEAFDKRKRRPVSTMVTCHPEDDLKALVNYALKTEGVSVVEATVRDGAAEISGPYVSHEVIYISDTDDDFKSIYDIRYAGDYADQERREANDYYAEKGVTHVFTLGGVHRELGEDDTVLKRGGTQLWPLPEGAEPPVDPVVKRTEQQKTLRDYVQKRKPG